MIRLLTPLALLSLILTATSCGRITDKTKEVINKGGEAAGKTATEFLEGVSEGVDKTLQCDIVLSQKLKDSGLKTGKFSINSDSAGRKDNLLTLYVIFDKDFKDKISLKAFDKSGLECGRTNMTIEGKAGDAKYYDFHFDKRTVIEVKSKILIE